MSDYNIAQRRPEYMGQTAKQVITKAKSQLMDSATGMTSILLGLDLIEDESIGTMATDGKSIIYSPDFTLSMKFDQIKGVLIHEALHVVWGHHIRRCEGGLERHPKLWNIATDYAINSYIVYDLHLDLPEGGLLDRKYQSWSANAIYDFLYANDEELEKAKSQVEKGLGQESDEQGESEQGESESGEDESQDEGQDEGQGQGQDEGESEGLEGEGEGQMSGQGGVNLDDLPQPVGGVIDMKGEEGQDLTPQEVREEQTRLDQQVLMAEKLEGMKGDSGNVDYLGGRAGEIKRPQVAWNDYLREILTSRKSNKRSYARLNKKYQHSGLILPSKKRENEIKNVVILNDVSGSTRWCRDEFITETMTLLEEFAVEKLWVGRYASNAFRNEQGEYFDLFDTTQGDCMPDKDTFPCHGSGGTRGVAGFNAFLSKLEERDEVDLLIHFSDGEDFFEMDELDEPMPDNLPVIHVFTVEGSYGFSNPDRDMPFGERVFIK